MLKTTNYRRTLQVSASTVPTKLPTAKPAKLSPWHAVSIAKGKQCCNAVAKLDGQRWLSAEAPQLPVKGCDAKDCECRYRHHDNRRGKLRRAEDQGVARRSLAADRRAEKHGRRAKDD